VAEGVTDAAGTPLVAVHAVRSNAAHSDAVVHRDKDHEMPTPTIPLMNGPATHPFFTRRLRASTQPHVAGAARARAAAHARQEVVTLECWIRGEKKGHRRALTLPVSIATATARFSGAELRRFSHVHISLGSASASSRPSPPLPERVDGRAKLAALFGQRIDHSRRNFRVHRARNKTGGLELAQARGDHLRVRVDKRALDLGETTRTGEEVLDDEKCPFVSNDLEGVCELRHSMVTLVSSACYLQALRVRLPKKEGHL